MKKNYMRMLQAIPALPVRNILISVDFYRGKLGFAIIHQEDGFAVIQCDAVKINLWVANDESWQKLNNSSPIVSGAESFIAGTASCRIEVDDVDELYHQIQQEGN
jgi:catechol 2,3-dioxygenase-like lactoylglutathione lyase family enzyme